MGIRSTIKRIIPGFIRQRIWKFYYGFRKKCFKTIIGGRTNEKLVALTFDDGPTPQGTTIILDTLAHHKVKATFFLLGKNVIAHPEIAKKILADGHAIGNHTFSHRRLVGCDFSTVTKEIKECQQAILQATGVNPTIMRPPYGDLDTKAYLAARLRGLKIINWNASGEDWKGDQPDQLIAHIESELTPGAIVLMHDGWETPPGKPEWQPEYGAMSDRSSTNSALSQLINKLGADGYSFCTVPELLQKVSPLSREWLVD